MQTIDQVIQQLEAITEDCCRRQSPQAYFAVLYLLMTKAVRQGIQTGYFEDGPRMERLDVLFAGRYVQAWESYQKQQPTTASWQLALDAATHNNLVVLQHLLLGINTHINLDLAIAAAQTSPGQSIFALQTDFDRINTLITQLTDTIQQRLETIAWPMKLLGKIANGKEKAVLAFSITKARQAAWANAVTLALLPPNQHAGHLQIMDTAVAQIGAKIMQPGKLVGWLLKIIRWFEPKSVTQTVEKLSL
ncbi:MAG TPA: DUF5995 family protein [Phnomibacter sp.]|nr:DUF5995 family protein [Phnomibacter sp.]